MMSGMGRRMPWTFGAFAVASLSMIGVPPVCGFVSKWYMVNGAVGAGHYALLAALLASTILNAAYFTPVVYKAFFEAPAPGVDLDHCREAPLTMVVPLCFTAGAIYVATHQKKISMMSGMGRRMPWTFGAFAVASLSMIGVPPVCGFVSKWYMVNGAVSAGHTALLAAMLASTILNAAYFTPVIYKAFFEPPAPGVDLDHYREAPLTMVAPLCFTAAASVFLGIYPETFIQLIQSLKGF
jgi:formate hydrogenlyase subunit 3/multisubunit Na+/H+ antiporter MnhD subunit